MRSWRASYPSEASHGLSMRATKAMNGSHVRTVSAVVDAGARRRWDTSLGYDAVQERIHQPQPIPPEYVTADFRDGRRFLPELRRVALAHTAP